MIVVVVLTTVAVTAGHLLVGRRWLRSGTLAQKVGLGLAFLAAAGAAPIAWQGLEPRSRLIGVVIGIGAGRWAATSIDDRVRRRVGGGGRRLDTPPR